MLVHFPSYLPVSVDEIKSIGFWDSSIQDMFNRPTLGSFAMRAFNWHIFWQQLDVSPLRHPAVRLRSKVTLVFNDRSWHVMNEVHIRLTSVHFNSSNPPNNVTENITVSLQETQLFTIMQLRFGIKKISKQENLRSIFIRPPPGGLNCYWDLVDARKKVSPHEVCGSHRRDWGDWHDI